MKMKNKLLLCAIPILIIATIIGVLSLNKYNQNANPTPSTQTKPSQALESITNNENAQSDPEDTQSSINPDLIKELENTPVEENPIDNQKPIGIETNLNEEEFKNEINKTLMEQITNNNFSDVIKNNNFVIDFSVYNETLTLNLTEDIQKLSFSSFDEEFDFLNHLTNAIVDQSQNNYTDVLFLVNGEKVERLFKYVDTSEPIGITIYK